MPIDTRTLSGGLTGLEMSHASLVRRLAGLATQLRKWLSGLHRARAPARGGKTALSQWLSIFASRWTAKRIRATAADVIGPWRCAKWQS